MAVKIARRALAMRELVFGEASAVCVGYLGWHKTLRYMED